MLFDSEHRLGVSAPFSRNVLIYVHAGINSYVYRTANFTGGQNAGGQGRASTWTAGGQGGRFDLDGEHASGFFWASVTDAGEAEESDTRLPLSLATDEAATAQERARARAERKHRGKPFAEFIAQWQQVRPSDDKLKYYGDWPEPHAPGYQKPFWGLHD